jgi:hypothetical protein
MADPESGTDRVPREGITVRRADLAGLSLGVVVPAAVASRRDANVVDMEPLWGTVDVDALDELWGLKESGCWSAGTRVTFRYMGYEVSVTPEVLHMEPIADEAGARTGP